MFRFREAVAAGAIPFTVQGPENALALDGGRTLGWEIGEQLGRAGVGALDRIFVQVGGGAFAACVGAHAIRPDGSTPSRPRVARRSRRAWDASAHDDRRRHRARRAPRWAELMTPWPDPHSLADGILDDETYDWLGVFDAIGAWGDAPIVAAEADVVAAHRSPVGRLRREPHRQRRPRRAAGDRRRVQPTERVAVVMSGVAR